MERNSALADHVVLSGGSRGVGLAISEALLADGYRVSTFSRKPTEDMERLAEAYPDRFHYEGVDIADSVGLSEFVHGSTERFGDLYGVINNSAIAVDGVLATLPEVEIARMLQINLEGSIRLARHGLRTMLRNRRGRIINISSIVGSRGYNGLAVYSATKAGLDGFTRSLAREVGRRKITVNSVAPGYMATDMSAGLGEGGLKQIVNRTPLGRLAEIPDIVPSVQFLLSDSASFITGQTIIIDGGITC